MTDRIIRVGHSPDPDDAFMFYGLASGKVRLEGIVIEHMLEDIQSLNVRAMKAELEVTAISAHAFPSVADDYWIMRTGASMGEGYGPGHHLEEVPVARGAERQSGRHPRSADNGHAALPDLHERNQPRRHAVRQDHGGSRQWDVDAGLLIHEGQITYQSLGYNKILDFGELWEKETNGLPLPLGLDVVRKDLGMELAVKLSRGLKESIAYGYEHQDESIPYAMQWGRGIERNLGEKFVKMYVSELTIDMGESGLKALDYLFERGYEKRIIHKVNEIQLV